MNRLRIASLSVLLSLASSMSAQWWQTAWEETVSSFDGAFTHLDVGVTASTTGLGLEAASPAGKYLRLRTGFTYMPRFQMTSNFPIDMNGVTSIGEDRRRRMIDVITNFTGREVRDNVDANMRPSWGNFKILIDVMPIPDNKQWSFTLGFFVGSSTIGRAKNAASGTPTLAAVSMYNSMYSKACKGEPMLEYEDSRGTMHDISLPDDFNERIVAARMAGMPLGYFSDGDRAMMVPDENYGARASMKVNSFRPYLGAGYNKELSSDGRWKLTVDAGLLFWGGSPHVYVDNVYKVNSENDYDMDVWNAETKSWETVQPQRIDLTHDVHNIPGKVGDMTKLVKHFKVYPSLSVTVSRNIF